VDDCHCTICLDAEDAPDTGVLYDYR